MDQSVREFLKDILPYRELYNSLDVRLLAYRLRDVWINIATKITLQTCSPADLKLERKLPELENLKVIHTICPARKLETLLDELSKAKICLNKSETLFGRLDENGIIPQLYLRNSIYSRNRPGFHGEINYKTFILADRGTSIHMIIKDQERIEWQLRAWNPPYNGLNDLSINFLRSGRDLDSNNATFIEIVAPTFIKFGDERKFEKDELILEVDHPQNVKLENVQFGIVRRSMKGDINRYLYGMKGYIVHHDDRKTFFRKKIRGCQSVQVFLKYNKDVADSVEVLSPKSAQFNPPLAVQKQFDHNLKNLQTLIRGDKDRHGINLEAGIPLLLSITGFQCLPYALTKKMQDGPDGIAFIPGLGQGLIYECTTGLPDTKNKLSKLSRRFRELRKKNPTLDLRPVIFTSAESDVIPDIEKDKASREGISIVGREQISEIFKAANDGCQEQEIFEYIIQLVPFGNRQMSTIF